MLWIESGMHWVELSCWVVSSIVLIGTFPLWNVSEMSVDDFVGLAMHRTFKCQNVNENVSEDMRDGSHHRYRNTHKHIHQSHRYTQIYKYKYKNKTINNKKLQKPESWIKIYSEIEQLQYCSVFYTYTDADSTNTDK